MLSFKIWKGSLSHSYYNSVILLLLYLTHTCCPLRFERSRCFTLETGGEVSACMWISHLATQHNAQLGMTTVLLPVWNSFRRAFLRKQKNTTTRRAPRNGTLFRIQKYQALKEIAPEPVIEKYSFNLQFESFMVSKCVNTATFSSAMTFCHHKKFINRQHLAQITFLPSQLSFIHWDQHVFPSDDMQCIFTKWRRNRLLFQKTKHWADIGLRGGALDHFEVHLDSISNTKLEFERKYWY